MEQWLQATSREIFCKAGRKQDVCPGNYLFKTDTITEPLYDDLHRQPELMPGEGTVIKTMALLKTY